MKSKKYLNMYNEWMEIGYFPFLCNYFNDYADGFELFRLFIPSNEELANHTKEGYAGQAWGLMTTDQPYEPTPLRQNIILLMAAMNNEL